MERQLLKQKFLKKHGLDQQHIIDFPADASFRKYSRIHKDNKSLILMDAPPDKEPIKPFIDIATILKNNNINAPEIFEHDIANGFIILEDFGDESFRKFLINNPDEELDLYKNAIDLLDYLAIPNLDIEQYSWEKIEKELSIFYDYYLKLVISDENQFIKHRDFLNNAFFEAFNQLYNLGDYLVLRDYHADNLHWLADNTGIHKVGTLDFQDALIGCPSYDLVSLLQDARRDLIFSENDYLRYYLLQNNFKMEEFLFNYYFFSLQRNLKIIGVFYRKKFRDSNDNYLKFIPRVWQYIDQVINHDFQDSSLSQAVNNFIPRLEL